MKHPTDLSEAIRYFSDVDVATEYVAGLRWPDGWVCPHCGGREYSYLSTRRLWKCRSCKKQSSVKVGTVFEGSALGLDKWLPAIWVVANPENRISSHELARALGTTQKSAWFMLHRIRQAEPVADDPAPLVEPISLEPLGEDTHPTHPGVWSRLSVLVAVGLWLFALGVFVGRLTKRIDPRSESIR